MLYVTKSFVIYVKGIRVIDMNREIKMNFLANKPSQIVTLIIATLVVAVTVYFYVTGLINSNRLKAQCTETTTGEVYTYEYSGKSRGLYQSFGARYTVDDVTYHASGSDGRGHNPGEHVQIHYDPNNHSISYAGHGPARLGEIPAFLFVFAGAMTMFACIKLLVTGKGVYTIDRFTYEVK